MTLSLTFSLIIVQFWDAIQLSSMDHIEDYRGIWRHPVKGKGDYVHRDQLNFYGLGGVKKSLEKGTDLGKIPYEYCVHCFGRSSG